MTLRQEDVRRRAVVRFLYRKTPHAHVNLNLSNHIEVGPLSWSEWCDLRGGGTTSFLRWLVALLTLTALPTEDDLRTLRHRSFIDAGVCHIYRDRAWCFCEEGE